MMVHYGVRCDLRTSPTVPQSRMLTLVAVDATEHRRFRAAGTVCHAIQSNILK